MDETNQTNPTPAAPASPQAAQPAMPVTASPGTTEPMAAQAMPAQAAPATPAAAPMPALNLAEWDKQKKQLNKQFYGSFSPRLFQIPFSMAVDKLRAKQSAMKAKYQPKDGGMVLMTPSKFWGKLMVEVTPGEGASGALDLSGKDLYTKVSTRPWPAIEKEIMELEKEMGQKPSAVYIWPASTTEKVLIGVYPTGTPAPAAMPAQAATPQAMPQPPTTPVEPAQAPPV